MDITYLESEVAKLEELRSKYDYNNFEQKFIRTHLTTAINKIKNKISDIKMENYYEKDLYTYSDSSGTYLVPTFISRLDESKNTYAVKGTLLHMPKKINFDKDGSFHIFCYAYVKLAEDKHVRVGVRALGNDVYGDRIFVDSYYYKSPSAYSSYYSNSYGHQPPLAFKQAVKLIISEIRKYPSFENFNPKFK